MASVHSSPTHERIFAVPLSFTLAKMTTLHRYSLHRIPKDASKPVAENTQGNEAVTNYVTSLLSWLRSDESNRSYDFPVDRLPETKTQILTMLGADDGGASFARSAQALAERLQEKQHAVQGGAIHVQEGVLLCADMDHDGQHLFLLAKLEFVDYLSEVTWDRQQGVPVEKNRPLKACCCVVRQDGQGGWEFADISVYDSNATIARFWWSDFLELTEHTTDQVNSKRAYDAWMSLLTEKVKRKHPADFMFLRSGIQFQFQTRPEYDHEQIVSATLDHYKATDATLDVAALAADARKLPAKHDRPGERFDPRFTVDAQACRIRITRISLSDEIQLVIRGGLQDFKADVMPADYRQQRGVFVVSEEGYNQLKGKQKKHG